MVRISVLLLAFSFLGCGSIGEKSKEKVAEKTAAVKLTDDELLATVQKQTFKYFWEWML